MGIKSKATEGKSLPKQGPQHYALFVVHINGISWTCTTKAFSQLWGREFHHVFISFVSVHRTSGIRGGEEISRGQPFLAFGKVFPEQKKL